MADHVAYTGKCKSCNHAESAHNKKLYIDGQVFDNACRHKDGCAVYVPVVDTTAHNTLDGKPPIELYNFQKRYLENLPPKYLFGADTGTGKTFMALAHYDKHAYLKPLLILAPAAKAKTGDWERDIQQYFAGRMVPEYEVYSYEKFSQVPTVAQYRKTGDRGVWRDWLNRHPADFAVIADEVHKAKNPQSKTGKAVFQTVTKTDFFVGLSATLLPNGWIDAANYYKMFGLVKDITSFKKRYCEIQTYKGFPEIVRYYHEGELQKFWNGIAKPLSKDAALDLPPLTSVPVRLDTDQDYYNVIKSRLFEDKFLDNPSALLHGLRRSLAGGHKITWLNNFLDETSDNVVIFYTYKDERDAILKMLAKDHKKRQVFRQDGELHEVPTKDKWTGLHRTITLAQYQSGSTGIEMTYANTIIYYSPTYSYSDYEQSVGRINRNGQLHKMTLYMLCAPDTVERDIWGALRNKSDFQVTQWYEKQLADGKVAKDAVY